jgi:hypothetical protein
VLRRQKEKVEAQHQVQFTTVIYDFNLQEFLITQVQEIVHLRGNSSFVTISLRSKQ